MATYFEKRMNRLALRREKQIDDYLAAFRRRQVSLENSIQAEIDRFIERYADASGLDIDEAEKLLCKQEQANWSMTLAEFREKAIKGGYQDELDLSYFKSRVSRLQRLKGQIYLLGAKQVVSERERLLDYLTRFGHESFYRLLYEITDKGAVDLYIDWGRFNLTYFKRVASYQWKGSDFSKRIWHNYTKELPERVSRALTLGAVHGWGIDEMKQEAFKGVKDVTKRRMYTLIQTESAHVAEMAAADTYKEAGIDQWRWRATLEVHTCDRCASLDGQVFDVDGNQAPPPSAHPNCRCFSEPVIDGWEPAKRWSRDPVTGKGEFVSNLTFKEWREQVA